MKTKVFTILAVVMLLSMWSVRAYAIWDIYSDTDIHSGFYTFINIYDTPPDHTTVNMYGGSLDYITTYDQSTLNFYGDSVQVGACDYSTINVTGGTLSGVEAYHYGTVNASGNGNYTYLSAHDFGIANMTGGIVDRISVGDFGTVNLFSGNVLDRLWANDSGVINIYGHDLFKTDSGGTYGYGQVYGYLTDDTYISVDLSNLDAYSHINLIPEPSSLLLLGLDAVMVRRKFKGLLNPS